MAPADRSLVAIARGVTRKRLASARTRHTSHAPTPRSARAASKAAAGMMTWLATSSAKRSTSSHAPSLLESRNATSSSWARLSAKCTSSCTRVNTLAPGADSLLLTPIAGSGKCGRAIPRASLSGTLGNWNTSTPTFSTAVRQFRQAAHSSGQTNWFSTGIWRASRRRRLTVSTPSEIRAARSNGGNPSPPNSSASSRRWTMMRMASLNSADSAPGLTPGRRRYSAARGSTTGG